MGNTNIKEVRKHRKGYDIIETIVDNDVYKITEEYKDDQGEVVYVYEYYPTTVEVLRAGEEDKAKKARPNNKINKKLDKIKNKYHN